MMQYVPISPRQGKSPRWVSVSPPQAACCTARSSSTCTGSWPRGRGQKGPWLSVDLAAEGLQGAGLAPPPPPPPPPRTPGSDPYGLRPKPKPRKRALPEHSPGSECWVLLPPKLDILQGPESRAWVSGDCSGLPKHWNPEHNEGTPSLCGRFRNLPAKLVVLVGAIGVQPLQSAP